MLLYNVIIKQQAITVQKFLNKVVKRIEKDLIVKLSYNFESYMFTNTVMFGLNSFTAEREKEVEEIKNGLISAGFDYSNFCIPQTFSFFHEIGHIVSSRKYGNDLILNYIDHLNKVEELNKDDRYTAEEKNVYYNLLPLEKDANIWALDFVKSNQDIVNEYQKEIIPLLRDLFNSFE